MRYARFELDRSGAAETYDEQAENYRAIRHRELSQRIAAQKSAGLIGLSFYPGSDREISHEDAARVALAMLEYADSVTPQF